MEDDDLKLSEAIKGLRTELEAAREEGAGKSIRFQPVSVDVEMSLVFKTEKGGEAGVKAWFVKASGKVSATDEATTKIKLTLAPVGADGKPTLVGSSRREKKTSVQPEGEASPP